MKAPKYKIFKQKDIEINVLYSVAGLATQILIKNTKTSFSFLIDCGDGTTRDLVSLDIDFHNLMGVALTHGHYDHCSGIHSLLGFMRMLGRTDNFVVIYPSKCVEIEGIIANFESNYKDNIPFSIEKIIVGLDEKPVKISQNLTITAYSVLHYGSTIKYGTGDKIPAVGYKFDWQNILVAYSGDSGPCEGLNKLFTKEIDYAIIEATHPDESWLKDKNTRYHLTVEEAYNYSKICRDSLLIHKLPETIVSRGP